MWGNDTDSDSLTVLNVNGTRKLGDCGGETRLLGVTVLDPPTGQTHYRDSPIRPLLADQLRLQIVLYLICVEIDRSKFGDRLDTERLEGLS